MATNSIRIYLIIPLSVKNGTRSFALRRMLIGRMLVERAGKIQAVIPV